MKVKIRKLVTFALFALTVCLCPLAQSTWAVSDC